MQKSILDEVLKEFRYKFIDFKNDLESMTDTFNYDVNSCIKHLQELQTQDDKDKIIKNLKEENQQLKATIKLLLNTECQGNKKEK